MTAAPSATEQTKRGKKAAPSGRLLLRMPAALHAELAQTAEREGVSLNQFITRALAGRIVRNKATTRAPPTVRLRLLSVCSMPSSVSILRQICFAPVERCS